MFKKQTITRLFLFVLITLVVVMATSCDTRNPDPNKYKVTDLSFFGENPTLVNDGVTSLELNAFVKDKEDFPIERQTVRFKANNQYIIFNKAFAESDSSGIARTTITYANGAPVEMSEVIISASIGTRVQRTIPIAIMHRDSIRVDNIDFLTTIPPSIEIVKQLQIRVQPQPEPGYIIPAGIGVTFTSENNVGSFFLISNPTDERQQITVQLDVNGVATVGWKSGTFASETRILASVANRTDSRPVVVRPGPARNITMDPPINSIRANLPGFEIPTYLYDAYDNIIPFRSISFEASLGSIDPESITNNEGVAYPVFTPGSQTGVANITATCGDSASAVISITVMSEGVAYLQFKDLGGINLNIPGLGGEPTKPVTVQAMDSSGNPYLPTVSIRFTIVSQPGGVTIGGNPISVDVMTSNGEASPIVSAGTTSGPVILRAQLLNNEGEPDNTVSQIQRSNIIVASGPPFFMSILTPYYGSAQPYEAAMWKVAIGALIQDVYRNPITKGTAVFFSIHEGLDGWTVSDTMRLTVEPFSYVYNVSTAGDSLPGVAYTTMIYHGSLSNVPVPIRVDIGGGFTATEWTILPMNQISIEVVWEPGYIIWDTIGIANPPVLTSANQLRQVRMIIIVRDGLQNPIRNAMLHFMEDKGFFVDPHRPGYSQDLFGPHNGHPTQNPPVPPSPGWAEEPTDFDYDPNGEDPIMGTINSPNRAPTDERGMQKKKWYSYRYMVQGMVPPTIDSANIRIVVSGADQQVNVQIPMYWWF